MMMWDWQYEEKDREVDYGKVDRGDNGYFVFIYGY